MKIERDLKLTQPMMQGEDVFRLQYELMVLGYEFDDIDGMFGPKTQAAVRKFQEDEGIKVDGIVGKITAKRINEKVDNLLKEKITGLKYVSLQEQQILVETIRNIYEMLKDLRESALGESQKNRLSKLEKQMAKILLLKYEKELYLLKQVLRPKEESKEESKEPREKPGLKSGERR